MGVQDCIEELKYSSIEAVQSAESAMASELAAAVSASIASTKAALATSVIIPTGASYTTAAIDSMLINYSKTVTYTLDQTASVSTATIKRTLKEAIDSVPTGSSIVINNTVGQDIIMNENIGIAGKSIKINMNGASLIQAIHKDDSSDMGGFGANTEASSEIRISGASSIVTSPTNVLNGVDGLELSLFYCAFGRLRVIIDNAAVVPVTNVIINESSMAFGFPGLSHVEIVTRGVKITRNQPTDNKPLRKLARFYGTGVLSCTTTIKEADVNWIDYLNCSYNTVAGMPRNVISNMII